MRYPLFITSLGNINREELDKAYSFVTDYRTPYFPLKIKPEKLEKKFFNDIKKAGRDIRKKKKINSNLLALKIYTVDNYSRSKFVCRSMLVEFYKHKNNSSQ